MDISIKQCLSTYNILALFNIFLIWSPSLVYILYSGVLLGCVEVFGEEAIKDRLYQKLFTNYTSQVPPLCASGDRVNITLDIALRQIVSLVMDEQSFEIILLLLSATKLCFICLTINCRIL